MRYSLRQKLGAILLDSPRYIFRLILCKLGFSQTSWLLIRNRDENIYISKSPVGVHCDWRWTSDLYLPKVFPVFSNVLLKRALKHQNFKLVSRPIGDLGKASPDVTFIIGHRGTNRLALLIKTLESIAAQRKCNIECIVVELDHQPNIKSSIPSWVKYIHKKTPASDTPYNRALAFNVGAQMAKANCLIFHDNDLLISDDYAFETLKLMHKGFDFINLKRFIFYLSKTSTDTFTTKEQTDIDPNYKVDSIMHNALGGGSIGCSLEAFKSIGGFDQRFVGWGGEDNEFWERAQTKKIWKYGNQALIHLWHDSQVEKLDLDKSPNLKFYNELRKVPVSMRIDWLKKHQNLAGKTL